MESRSSVPLRLHSAGATDLGRGRTHNEDAVLLRPDLQLYVVADGAGGHNAGNVASALATATVANYFEATAAEVGQKPEIDAYGMSIGARRLAIAIQKANREIVEIAKSSNKHKGMGTTIVAMSISHSAPVFHVAHVGDSRCFRLRAGQLEQLTYDHSLLNDVLELRPDIDDAKLARLPRNVVTRALGMEDHVRVSVRTYQMLTGDKYLLCSDGLTDALDPDEIADVLHQERHPDDLVKLFIEMANAAGAEDNIAALVVACEVAPSAAPWKRRRTVAEPRAEMTTIVDSSEQKPPTTEESSPEIVIVGVDDQTDIVPQETATTTLRDALDAIRARNPRRL